jgi:hypothetical protein
MQFASAGPDSEEVIYPLEEIYICPQLVTGLKSALGSVDTTSFEESHAGDVVLDKGSFKESLCKPLTDVGTLSGLRIHERTRLSSRAAESTFVDSGDRATFKDALGDGIDVKMPGCPASTLLASAPSANTLLIAEYPLHKTEICLALISGMVF